MDNVEQFSDKLKKLFHEASILEKPILLRAVNIEDKIFTPPFLITNLKFEGDILTIPNIIDKSHFLITPDNYHSWHFLRSTNIRTEKNNLIYDFDIIGFVTYKKTIFGNTSWKIDKAPPPFIVTYKDSNLIPTISILPPMRDEYSIAGLFTSERINELQRKHGFNIYLIGNFAIPSKMNAELFTIHNVHLTSEAIQYK